MKRSKAERFGHVLDLTQVLGHQYVVRVVCAMSDEELPLHLLRQVAPLLGHGCGHLLMAAHLKSNPVTDGQKLLENGIRNVRIVRTNQSPLVSQDFIPRFRVVETKLTASFHQFPEIFIEISGNLLTKIITDIS